LQVKTIFGKINTPTFKTLQILVFPFLFLKNLLLYFLEKRELLLLRK
jgi:hypothetical protein